MTVHLIVGLPGAGKTAYARGLEVSESAVRFTPDEWQMAVFDQDSPSTWRSKERSDHRFRIEGKLLEIGLRVAQLGLPVIFDFGFWSTDERSALRWIAASLGVDTRVVYLPIGYEEQRRRIRNRFENEPGQFEMSDEELRQWHVVFQPPDPDELAGGSIPAAPQGFPTWSHWASTFWPSLPEVGLLGVGTGPGVLQ